MELLTQAAFAKLIGVSAPRVSKLVAQGRIPKIGNKIPKDEALEAWGNSKVIGFDKAGEAGSKYGGDPKTTKQAVRGYKQDNLDESDDETAPDDEELGKRYNKAKTLEKEWMARRRQLDYEVEKKKYILVSDVKNDAQALAAMIRQKIISVAPMIAATSEGKTALQIQRIVEIELNEALKELQKLDL